MMWNKEQSARILIWGIRFFLTAALTASQMPGGYTPFALGCIAAAGPGAEGMAALVGAATGAALFLEFSDALRYLATAVLIFTASTAFWNSKIMSRPSVLALTAAALSLAVGGIYVVQSLSPMDHLTPCVAAAGITGAAAWFFRPLFRPEEDGSVADGILFLGAAFLLGLAELELMGLSAYAGLPASSLAYGQQRRLEIARALAAEPKLLLLDEPAAGMNSTEKMELNDRIRRIIEMGTTVLIVEHDMAMVMNLADKILVLNSGKLLAEGSAEEISNNEEVIEAYLGRGDDE